MSLLQISLKFTTWRMITSGSRVEDSERHKKEKWANLTASCTKVRCLKKVRNPQKILMLSILNKCRLKYFSNYLIVFESIFRPIHLEKILDYWRKCHQVYRERIWWCKAKLFLIPGENANYRIKKKRSVLSFVSGK